MSSVITGSLLIYYHTKGFSPFCCGVKFINIISYEMIQLVSALKTHSVMFTWKTEWNFSMLMKIEI